MVGATLVFLELLSLSGTVVDGVPNEQSVLFARLQAPMLADRPWAGSSKRAGGAGEQKNGPFIKDA